MKAAIIGTQGSGKTTLFCGLSGGNYAPGTTSKFNTATVNLEDPRIGKLEEFFQPVKKSVYPQVDFTDGPAIYFEPELRDKNPETLHHLREHDCILIVIPAFLFEPTEVVEKAVRYFNDMHSELVVADLKILEARAEKLRSQIARNAPTMAQDKKELSALEIASKDLETTQKIDIGKLNSEQEKAIRCFAFFSSKPVIPVLNCGDAPVDPAKLPPEFYQINASLELELRDMAPEEAKEFLSAYGITKPRFSALARICYDRMGLMTFYTAGKPEVHGWTIRKGSTGLDAAGKIHSDIARGFISSEMISYEDWEACGGSMKDLKAKAKIRMEGKTYLMREGDMALFKFNV